jgi:hypothetical protein
MWFGQTKQELFWGGPLSFDMVHTHILNMKMRRSRLKERLKEAALKRKVCTNHTAIHARTHSQSVLHLRFSMRRF